MNVYLMENRTWIVTEDLIELLERVSRHNPVTHDWKIRFREGRGEYLAQAARTRDTSWNEYDYTVWIQSLKGLTSRGGTCLMAILGGRAPEDVTTEIIEALIFLRRPRGPVPNMPLRIRDSIPKVEKIAGQQGDLRRQVASGTTKIRSLRDEISALENSVAKLVDFVEKRQRKLLDHVEEEALYTVKGDHR